MSEQGSLPGRGMPNECALYKSSAYEIAGSGCFNLEGGAASCLMREEGKCCCWCNITKTWEEHECFFQDSRR